MCSNIYLLKDISLYYRYISFISPLWLLLSFMVSNMISILGFLKRYLNCLLLKLGIVELRTTDVELY